MKAWGLDGVGFKGVGSEAATKLEHQPCLNI